MWIGEPHPFPERGSTTKLRTSGQQSYKAWSCRTCCRNTSRIFQLLEKKEHNSIYVSGRDIPAENIMGKIEIRRAENGWLSYCGDWSWQTDGWIKQKRMRRKSEDETACREINGNSSFFISFYPLLAIRKHYTMVSYKLMCWQLGQWPRRSSIDVASVCRVEGPSSF